MRFAVNFVQRCFPAGGTLLPARDVSGIIPRHFGYGRKAALSPHNMRMICSTEHSKSELEMSQFADEDYIVFYCHYYVVPACSLYSFSSSLGVSSSALRNLT